MTDIEIQTLKNNNIKSNLRLRGFNKRNVGEKLFNKPITFIKNIDTNSIIGIDTFDKKFYDINIEKNKLSNTNYEAIKQSLGNNDVLFLTDNKENVALKKIGDDFYSISDDGTMKMITGSGTNIDITSEVKDYIAKLNYEDINMDVIANGPTVKINDENNITTRLSKKYKTINLTTPSLDKLVINKHFEDFKIGDIIGPYTVDSFADGMNFGDGADVNYFNKEPIYLTLVDIVSDGLIFSNITSPITSKITAKNLLGSATNGGLAFGAPLSFGNSVAAAFIEDDLEYKTKSTHYGIVHKNFPPVTVSTRTKYANVDKYQLGCAARSIYGFSSNKYYKESEFFKLSLLNESEIFGFLELSSKLLKPSRRDTSIKCTLAVNGNVSIENTLKSVTYEFMPIENRDRSYNYSSKLPIFNLSPKSRIIPKSTAMDMILLENEYDKTFGCLCTIGGYGDNNTRNVEGIDGTASSGTGFGIVFKVKIGA